jgi:hypothetical protein
MRVGRPTGQDSSGSSLQGKLEQLCFDHKGSRSTYCGNLTLRMPECLLPSGPSTQDSDSLLDMSLRREYLGGTEEQEVSIGPMWNKVGPRGEITPLSYL